MQRRNVLKLAGATGAFAAVGGVAAAQEDDDGGGRNGCSLPDCIHPVLGYTGFSPDEQLPSELQPDHEVDLLIQPRAGGTSDDDQDDDGDDDGDDRDDDDDDREIEPPIPEFYFEPTGLSIEPGDVVRFNLATPDHTVTAYHQGFGRQRRVPEGVPPFSSPVLAGGSFWLYRFDEPGVYDLLCAPHEIFGMVMRLVVGDADASFDEPGEGSRPPELTAALVFRDSALDPNSIAEAGAVSWADIGDRNKRLLFEIDDDWDDDMGDDDDDDDNDDDGDDDQDDDNGDDTNDDDDDDSDD